MDPKRAAEFEERLLGAMNGGALAIMTSIGHRTGLFDAMATLPPSTSEAIARAAGLNERYVREWLGAMVVGRFVDHDPEAGTYALPPEHAGFLTRAATPNNFAAVTQYVGLFGTVEDRIVQCFREGGGVPYSEFPRFHAVMREDSGQTVLPALFDAILPLAPGVIEQLEAGIDVLDVGCGSGLALCAMAERFPASRFVGYDFSDEGIRYGREQAAARGLRNVRFEVVDVAGGLADERRFQLITAFDAIHDQAHPRRVLANIARALRRDGVFLMQDIAGHSHHAGNLDHPLGPLLYTVSCMHCMTVSLASGGEGLGAMWGEEKARALLAEAGFAPVEVHHLGHDIQNCYYVARLAA